MDHHDASLPSHASGLPANVPTGHAVIEMRQSEHGLTPRMQTHTKPFDDSHLDPRLRQPLQYPPPVPIHPSPPVPVDPQQSAVSHFHQPSAPPRDLAPSFAPPSLSQIRGWAVPQFGVCALTAATTEKAAAETKSTENLTTNLTTTNDTLSAKSADSHTINHNSPFFKMTCENPRKFLDTLDKRLGNDTRARAKFFESSRDYADKKIAELEYYVAMYCAMLRTGCLDLLPGLLPFLPPAWQKVDLTWLNEAIEANFAAGTTTRQNASNETMDPGVEEKDPDNTDSGTMNLGETGTAGIATEGIATEAIETTEIEQASNRKRAPRNAFRATPSGAAPPPCGPVPSPPTGPAPPSLQGPPLQGPPLEAPAPPVVPKKRKRGRTASTTSSAPPDVTTKSQPRVTTTTTTNPTGPTPTRTLYGPLFKDRRSILARSSKPYIHAACNKRFTHPDEVKRHHTICKEATKEGLWDEHPSCKVGYKEIKYAQVKDGFVLLDKESWEKIQGCIEAGLKGREEEEE